MRLFSILSSIAILGSLVSMPLPAAANEDCHPAYKKFCVPTNLSGAQRIPVEAGTKTTALCIKLGEWEGENPVVVEWNDRYAARTVKAKGYTNAVRVMVKRGKEPGYLRVYSPKSDRRVGWEWKTCNTSMANNIENFGWKKYR